jgi:hypothetical protein
MNYRVHYEGSWFWLIFWAIFFFPIALVLLLTKWSAEGNGKRIDCEYNGSRFWLGFWTLFFFPITIVLLINTGLRVETR